MTVTTRPAKRAALSGFRSACRRCWASWPGRRGAAGPVGRGRAGVLAELMAEEVEEVVGPKGRHDPERAAVRHGHEAAR